MWRVKASKVHGSGVFATKNIKKNLNIIEYIGEKVPRSQGDKRSAKRIKDYLHSEETGSLISKTIIKNFKEEIKNFIQVCPKEMINKLVNPITLKSKIKEVS